MNWLFDPWVIHIKTLLKACWFRCVCWNHNKNKMCSDSSSSSPFFWMGEREKKTKLAAPICFIRLSYKYIFDSAFALFLFSDDEDVYWMRLFCVKTIFTPHSLVRQSDAIEKLIIFILMTGGNSFQGHPVNEQNELH